MVAGSAYWESDRAKRNEYNELKSDVEKKEKHQSWLKELEARQEEEDELRSVRDRVLRERFVRDRAMETTSEMERRLGEQEKRVQEAEFKAEVGQNPGGFGKVQSALEAGESTRDGPVLSAVRLLWERRR